MRTNPIPSPVDLLDPGIEPGSQALQVDFLPVELPGKPCTQSSAPTLDTSTWCGVPSHPLLPFQPAETEGAGPDTGGHSRATPGPSSV